MPAPLPPPQGQVAEQGRNRRERPAGMSGQMMPGDPWTAGPERHEAQRQGDLVALKNQCFVLKEGVDYRVKITFKVNKEIVSGLKYLHNTYRKSIRVDKAVYMVGSYGPRAEEYEFLTPVEEAPKGMLVRGTYHIKSQFTDDDQTDHLSWEWNLNIKKDWKD